ncbi:HIT family protein [archaeon]|nr:HIT family protein [archaeon]|tara:strand:- start:7306 stop:7722 length:417 start_codon:yes stop_codon:yes gene_type:complete
MTNKDCIFCKIINKEIPSDIIYEDKDFISILDINPIKKGHSLIIPKKHSLNITDFPENKGNSFMKFAKKISNAIVKSTKADGFNLAINNGQASGQAVFHTHFHVIPRHNNDGLSQWPRTQYKDSEKENLKNKIIKLIS